MKWRGGGGGGECVVVAAGMSWNVDITRPVTLHEHFNDF